MKSFQTQGSVPQGEPFPISRDEAKMSDHDGWGWFRKCPVVSRTTPALLSAFDPAA